MNVSTADRLIESYALIGAANKRSLEQLRLVLREFQAQGIVCILLKGADLIQRLYGVWGLRPMVDVDLLVREHDLPAIDRIVTGLGYLPQIDGNPAYRSAEGTLALDLITEIWYTDDTEGIWRRTVQRDLTGFPVKGMGTDDLLMYLTAYSVLHRGYFPPSFPKDIALLVEKERVDWEFVVDEAIRRNLKVPLLHGLSYAVWHESIPIPTHVLESLAPIKAKEKVLQFVLQKLVTDKAVDGMGHFLLLISQPEKKKCRRLQQAFWPSPAFLKYRYGECGKASPIWIRLRRAMHLAAQALRLSARIVSLLTKRNSPATS